MENFVEDPRGAGLLRSIVPTPETRSEDDDDI